MGGAEQSIANDLLPKQPQVPGLGPAGIRSKEPQLDLLLGQAGA